MAKHNNYILLHLNQGFHLLITIIIILNIEWLSVAVLKISSKGNNNYTTDNNSDN